jgi:hypothetical protein
MVTKYLILRHVTKHRFPFFEPFRARLHSKDRKNTFLQKFNKNIKNAEFYAGFEAVGMLIICFGASFIKIFYGLKKIRLKLIFSSTRY